MTNEQLIPMIRAGIDTAGNMYQLWQQNKRFITMIAKKYSAYAELDDLEQEGYLALCTAVEKYDPEQGVPFINYAALWIRQYMRRYIENCCGSVRIPVYVHEGIREYNRIVHEYEKHYGEEPPDSAVCRIMGISLRKLNTIKENAGMAQILSLDSTVDESGELTLGDMVASDDDIEGDVIERFDKINMKRELWDAVGRLESQQHEAIIHRFRDGMTIKDTGIQMGVSIERVRQIQNKALKMLRLPGRNSGFIGYYEEYLKASCYRHVGVGEFSRTWTSEVEREALDL